MLQEGSEGSSACAETGEDEGLQVAWGQLVDASLDGMGYKVG